MALSIKTQIKFLAKEFGFAKIGIANLNLHDQQKRFANFLEHKFYGDMHYLTRYQDLRNNPKKLFPTLKSIISCSMLYEAPLSKDNSQNALDNIAAYAKQRDYHKVMRQQLNNFAKKINDIAPHNYRVFCDSAPLFEKTLAASAGLGWIGKNGLLINNQYGSYIFLGEIFTDLSFPEDKPAKNRCGKCERCLNICPTKALLAPYSLDATRCIAYLTIEYRGVIPINLRPLIGEKIFGCDLCQQVCPWNKFAKKDSNKKFLNLEHQSLADLFLWDEKKFLETTAGTVLRRLNYECWLRNIAIALGNSKPSKANLNALKLRQDHTSNLVRNHVEWALGNYKS